LENPWSEIRHALRSLRKAPAMSAVAIVTLAVGIAAVTTIFSFVDSVFYRALPYPDADRIVAVTAFAPKGYYSWGADPIAVVDAFRRDARTFERAAAFHEQGKFLALDENSRSVGVTAIDTSVLTLLQAKPQRGRLITNAEIRSLAPVALISDSLWRSAYGASEAAVGTIAKLDGVSYSIVGVLPKGYRFYARSDVLVPLAERPDSVDPGIGNRYGFLGKLRPGASVATAQREVDQIGVRLAATDAQFKRWRYTVESGMYDRSNGFGKPVYSWLFIGVATCVLLIACANVANLLLVRAAERRPEMAIRTSLGASRARLIRLALVESVILAVVAGTLGVLLSIWGSRLLLVLIPTTGFPSFIRLGMNVHVLEFTLVLSMIVVAAIGVSPALEGTKLDLVKALKAGGDTMVATGSATRRGRRSVALEIALSVMLFVGAALFFRSFQNVNATDVGYPSDRMISPWVTIDRSRYASDSSQMRFQHALADRLAADAHVEQVATRGYAFRLDVDEVARKKAGAATRELPASYQALSGHFLTEDRATQVDRDMRPQPQKWSVSDSYFKTMGLPILQGRGFDGQDQAGSAPVAVVSEALARVFWKRPDVLGRTFSIGPNGTLITVVGIVRDYKRGYRDASGVRLDAWPTVYYSERQVTPNGARPIIRARGDVNALARAIPALLHDVDAQATITRLQTMNIEEAGEARFLAQIFGSILGTLALCALLMAAMGTWGVIAYGVALRTREIGLRIALGGTQGQVIRLFVNEGMRAIGIGLAIGVVIALAATQILRALLVGVTPFDPLTYGVTIVFFGVVALLACWLPARRAARVEPMRALRGE
jgi:putative ABC transport system permease protein